MSTRDLKSAIRARPLLLDGATGTWLQENGLAAHDHPELWVLDHPQILIDLQTAYLAAGSQILYAFTFGANRPKLKRRGINEDQVHDLNLQLTELSCRVKQDFLTRHPQKSVWVAGDLAPTGEFLQPAGTMSFDDLVLIYREQAAGQLAAGVDLFVVETMYDLAQARAAVLAIRDLCDLPVFVTMTLEDHGRTLSGNLPSDCLLSLASLGIDAFGLNCSHGPEKLRAWLAPLLAESPVPLIAKPNAGMPRQEGGQTVFPMQAAEFAAQMTDCAEDGILLLGGCCGTSPEYIANMKQRFCDMTAATPLRLADSLPPKICSARQSWQVDAAKLTQLPVAVPVDAEELLADLLDLAEDEPPALRIDIRHLPDWSSDNAIAWTDALQEAQSLIQTPLIFEGDVIDRKSLQFLLRYHHGRAGLFHRDDLALAGTCFIPRSS